MENWYENLKILLSSEEEIRYDLEELRETTEWWYETIIKDKEEIEIRHIFWYMDIIFERKSENLNMRNLSKYHILYIGIDFTKPLYSQPEVCQKIYEYLRDL